MFKIVDTHRRYPLAAETMARVDAHEAVVLVAIFIFWVGLTLMGVVQILGFLMGVLGR